MDDGLGREDDALAAGPQAPAEVHVLQVGEVVLVEAAGRQERGAADEHVAAAGEGELLPRRRHPGRRQGPAEVELEGVAVEGHEAAAEVQALAGPVHDLAGDGGHVRRRRAQGLHQRAQPARLRPGVVVEQGHGVAVRAPPPDGCCRRRSRGSPGFR